jgi:hypothetical protein
MHNQKRYAHHGQHYCKNGHSIVDEYRGSCTRVKAARTLLTICPNEMHELVLVGADSKLALANVRSDSRVTVILLNLATLEFNLRPLTLLLGLLKQL